WRALCCSVAACMCWPLPAPNGLVPSPLWGARPSLRPGPWWRWQPIVTTDHSKMATTTHTHQALRDFVTGLPKTELHVHIEGTLEPEMIFELAQRNGVPLAYASEQALRDAYAFTDLQSFLDLYYAGASVLITERD